VEIPCDPLLITFLMKKDGPEIQLRCRGCREIVPPEHPGPSHTKGVIELDGQLIPVIDPNARFSLQETEIRPCSCIVVIEHEGKSQSLRTGVIVGDIEEVMQLAAGSVTMPIETGISTAWISSWRC
jgi:chemotaxis signal transduction protein